jgi:hypothetical protein
MNMVEVKAKARLLGIKTSQKKKGDLIRQIQRAEGNFDCFGTAKEYCDQQDCCFKEDCLSSINPKIGGGL